MIYLLVERVESSGHYLIFSDLSNHQQIGYQMKYACSGVQDGWCVLEMVAIKLLFLLFTLSVQIIAKRCRIN